MSQAALPQIRIELIQGIMCYKLNEGSFTYHHRFPIDWAIEHTSETNYCLDCKNISERTGDIFIGYCSHCAIYIYKMTRGVGITRKGLEYPYDDLYLFDRAYNGFLSQNNLMVTRNQFELLSIFNTYMKGASLNLEDFQITNDHPSNKTNELLSIEQDMNYSRPCVFNNFYGKKKVTRKLTETGIEITVEDLETTKNEPDIEPLLDYII